MYIDSIYYDLGNFRKEHPGSLMRMLICDKVSIFAYIPKAFKRTQKGSGVPYGNACLCDLISFINALLTGRELLIRITQMHPALCSLP